MPTSGLAIRCQFLNGTYQAAAPGSIGEAEWPPHPARLHAALIAAGWAQGADAFPAEAHAALRWLESLPPPALAYPRDVRPRTAPDVFVPRNLTGEEVRDVVGAMRSRRDPSRQSGRVSRRFPTSIVGDEPAWFIWESDDSAHRTALSGLAREVQYLGSSRSPVCCDVAEEPPSGIVLVPEPGDPVGTALRVATTGFTDELLAARGIYPPPTFGALQPYRATSEPAPPELKLLAGPFGELAVRAFEPAFPLTILHAPLIARAFREAVLAHAGDDAPPVLHGHECNPHVAFLPLANVGHTHATGQVLGVAAAIPRSVTAQDRDAILHAVNRVERLDNIVPGNSWRLHRGTGRTVRTLAPERWLGPARRWQTVTPVILDRYPKRRQAEPVLEVLRETFTNAGAPMPSHLEWSRISWQAAAVPSPAYRGHGLPDGLRLHLDAIFAEPVRGPLLIGRGRYFGVGLFSPVLEQTAPTDDG